MAQSTTLIVPGYKGSGETHWQTWIENHIAGAQRINQNWDEPILARWADNIRLAIDHCPQSVWLVAHSFGCLASVAAAVDRADKISGLMLVAPADPERFTPSGVRPIDDRNSTESIRGLLPTKRLKFPSIIIASTNDPWMQLAKAKLWGECWGSKVLALDSVGHINTASGFGPWPLGLKLLREFKSIYDLIPLGEIDPSQPVKPQRGRGSQLAKARHITRQHLGFK